MSETKPKGRKISRARKRIYSCSAGRECPGGMPEVRKKQEHAGAYVKNDYLCMVNSANLFYGNTRGYPPTRRTGSASVRCVRGPEYQRRGGAFVRYVALRPLFARQGNPSHDRDAFGGAERSSGSCGRTPGPSRGDARGDDPCGVAHPRRRDRRVGHAPRTPFGQRPLAVASRRTAGRLHSRTESEHRHVQRPVRSGNARLQFDGHALRGRGSAKRLRGAAQHDAPRLFRHHP